jgi:nucleoside-diphosphate-sugar epimerase
MRVAVVGATGNAGTALVRALSREDAVEEIVGIARRVPGVPGPRVTWRSADIVRDDLAGLLRGSDAVVHLAWLIQPSRHEDVTYATNVEGSRRVFEAAVRAGVPAVVYASSVGAYSPGPKDRFVDERWPTDGIPTSFYSRHKAAVERILDRVEADHPDTRFVRLRPGLKFQRDAASEIRRLFAGPFLPRRLVHRRLIPVVPRIPRLRFQAVHTDDVADAYRRAILRDVRGAFNVAADPVLDPDELARLLRARTVPVPGGIVRAAAAATWRLRLQPTPPGWVDLALGVPLMDTARARAELGWAPRHSAGDAFLELLDGMRDGAGARTPTLDPDAGGRLREREVATGVGGASM